MFRLFKKIIKRMVSWAYLFISPAMQRYAILDSDSTIKEICRRKISVSRYGDGEIKEMLGIENYSFQTHDKKLEKRLREVISSDDQRILTCIPIAIKEQKNLTRKSKTFWRVFTVRYCKGIINVIPACKTYGNASFTRPYITQKKKDNVGKAFESIKKIWEKQDVLIIEGEYTRFGVGNDLLDNAKTIQRIICPSKNAYCFYDEILEAASKYGGGKLILLALGPTATVLAYDLARKDYWAIDVGHIDIEYEWMKMGAKDKTKVKGKFVNESNDDSYINESISDRDYFSSIIKRIR